MPLDCHCRQAAESKEALEAAKVKEAAAEAKEKEASSKLAGLVAREQAVADHKEQQAAAVRAMELADQVGWYLLPSLRSWSSLLCSACWVCHTFPIA